MYRSTTPPPATQIQRVYALEQLWWLAPIRRSSCPFSWAYYCLVTPVRRCMHAPLEEDVPCAVLLSFGCPILTRGVVRYTRQFPRHLYISIANSRSHSLSCRLYPHLHPDRFNKKQKKRSVYSFVHKTMGGAFGTGSTRRFGRPLQTNLYPNIFLIARIYSQKPPKFHEPGKNTRKYYCTPPSPRTACRPAAR